MSVNLAVVRGVCSSPPTSACCRRAARSSCSRSRSARRRRQRGLGSRGHVGSARRRSQELDAGDEIVAFGRVRRRFFRSGGGTASRVEIEAEHVVAARDRRRVQASLRRATARSTPLVT